jgi:hypothetical protein
MARRKHLSLIFESDDSETHETKGKQYSTHSLWQDDGSWPKVNLSWFNPTQRDSLLLIEGPMYPLKIDKVIRVSPDKEWLAETKVREHTVWITCFNEDTCKRVQRSKGNTLWLL